MIFRMLLVSFRFGDHFDTERVSLLIFYDFLVIFKLEIKQLWKTNIYNFLDVSVNQGVVFKYTAVVGEF